MKPLSAVHVITIEHVKSVKEWVWPGLLPTSCLWPDIPASWRLSPTITGYNSPEADSVGLQCRQFFYAQPIGYHWLIAGSQRHESHHFAQMHPLLQKMRWGWQRPACGRHSLPSDCVPVRQLVKQVWCALCPVKAKQSKILEGQEAVFCDVFIMSFFTLFLFMWYLKWWNTLAWVWVMYQMRHSDKKRMY